MKWGNQPCKVPSRNKKPNVPKAEPNMECPNDESGRLVTGVQVKLEEMRQIRKAAMARTHWANHLLESLPGCDMTTLNRTCLKLNSLHFLLLTNISLSFFPVSANWNYRLYGPSQNCHGHPQLLLFLHAFHLIIHQFLSTPSLRCSLNLPSSLSDSAFIQALIIVSWVVQWLLYLCSCPLAGHPSYHYDFSQLWIWFCYFIT